MLLPLLYRPLRLLIVLCLAVSIWVVPVPVAACSLPPGRTYPPTITERTMAAPVVLVGQVLSTSPRSTEFASYSANVQVEQYVKGAGPAVIEIRDFGPGNLCRSDVAAGQRLIFFASGDPVSGFHAFYLTASDATAAANQQSITEARSAAGIVPRLWLAIVTRSA